MRVALGSRKMRIPSYIIYVVIIVLGALLISQVLNFLDLDPMPLDITINRENLHIHIPVLYSLGVSVVLALLFWYWRR
jgi:hypothetical protein